MVDLYRFIQLYCSYIHHSIWRSKIQLLAKGILKLTHEYLFKDLLSLRKIIQQPWIYSENVMVTHK